MNTVKRSVATRIVWIVALTVQPWTLGMCQPNRPNHVSIAATPRGSEVSIYSGRPLDELAWHLDTEYGWLVDFEDAPVRATSTFEDTATERWHRENPGKRALNLKSRDFRAQISLPMTGSTANAYRILQQVVDQYNSADNPDRFLVIQNATQRVSLVGIAAKGDDETMADSTPLLNTPVQLQSVRETMEVAINDLIAQLSAATGAHVVSGTMPLNLADRNFCTPLSGTHPAREELTSLLDQTPYELAWSLKYDRGDNAYVLNITAVTRPLICPAGPSDTKPSGSNLLDQRRVGQAGGPP